MKKFVSACIAVLVSVVVCMSIAEVVLRFFPVLISEPILVEFNKDLRSKVAEIKNLPVRKSRRCIPSEERSDNGPELCLIPPNADYFQKADPIDKEYGAIELLEHDERGFCNTRSQSPRSHAEIIMLGDSFTHCTSIAPAETFSSLVEKAIGSPVYNLGVPGVGPYEYLEVFKRFGPDMHPSIVVMNIYEGNDLRDAVRYFDHKEKIKSANNKSSIGSYADAILNDVVLSKSYSINFILAGIEVVASIFTKEKVNFLYSVEIHNSRIDMNVANSDQDEVKLARKLRVGKIDVHMWDDAIDEFSQLAKTHDFQPVITYLPSAYTAYARSVRFEDSRVGEDVMSLSRAQRTYLQETANRVGIPFLDLTEYMQEQVADSGIAYFPSNIHLTKSGHELVAKFLVAELNRGWNSADGGRQRREAPGKESR